MVQAYLTLCATPTKSHSDSSGKTHAQGTDSNSKTKPTADSHRNSNGDSPGAIGGAMMLVNYDMRKLSQPFGGHIVPVAAWHAGSRHWLLADVWTGQAVWASADDLWYAMVLTDTERWKQSTTNANANASSPAAVVVAASASSQIATAPPAATAAANVTATAAEPSERGYLVISRIS
jgi:hypothetical protein